MTIREMQVVQARACYDAGAWLGIYPPGWRYAPTDSVIEANFTRSHSAGQLGAIANSREVFDVYRAAFLRGCGHEVGNA